MPTYAWRIAISMGAVALVLLFGSTTRAESAMDTLTTTTMPAALSNELCPVMPQTKVEPEIWTEFRGQRVYFCHEICKTRFLRDPEKYLKNLPPEMVQAMDHGSHPPPPGPAGQVAAAHGHDHAHDHPTGVPESSAAHRVGRFLGRFHPVAVHLPIGLLIGAAVAEVLLMWSGKVWFGDAARFCVLLGSLAAPVAATLGWLAAAGASYGGELASALETHRWMGTATASLAIILAIVSEWSRRKPARIRLVAYRGSLFLTFAVVGVTGHLGGTLVYGLNWLTP